MLKNLILDLIDKYKAAISDNERNVAIANFTAQYKAARKIKFAEELEDNATGRFNFKGWIGHILSQDETDEEKTVEITKYINSYLKSHWKNKVHQSQCVQDPRGLYELIDFALKDIQIPKIEEVVGSESGSEESTIDLGLTSSADKSEEESNITPPPPITAVESSYNYITIFCSVATVALIGAAVTYKFNPDLFSKLSGYGKSFVEIIQNKASDLTARFIG